MFAMRSKRTYGIKKQPIVAHVPRGLLQQDVRGLEASDGLLAEVDILQSRRFATACGRITSSAKDARQPGLAFSDAGFYFLCI